MPLATKTTDEIRSEFLRDMRLLIPGAKTQDGSDYFAIGSALAGVVAPIYANGRYFENEFDPRTASEAALQRLANIYGVLKRGAEYSSGTVTVSTSYPTSLPDGSILVNDSTGDRYETVGITPVGGSLAATANVIAVDPGSAADADPGTSLTLESPPPGFNPKAVVVSISGGDDAWDKKRWADEILKVIRSRPMAGNIAHVLAIANAVAGVEQAFVYPALRGSGTLDVVVVTSQNSGTRVAGTALLNRVAGALQFGVQESGGVFLPGIPEDVYKNTRVHAAVEEDCTLNIGYKASKQNPFAAWPPTVDFNDEDSWYKVTSATSATLFVVGVPSVGTPVAPVAGDEISIYFDSVGFVKGVIGAVSGAGPWTITMASWSTTPSDAPNVNAVVTPWSSQLQGIATFTKGKRAGAAMDYFATLGPGEMIGLTEDDVTRRRRWPRVGDKSPYDGAALWPTDMSKRMIALLAQQTDGVDFDISSSPQSPSVPSGSHLDAGAPPSILTPYQINVIPL
jgi:uncharacterized phage protein gp47/JayE